MDCYSYIKMINYIRLQKPHPKLLLEAPVALWEDDCYLKPGEMEPWLMYDFEDLGSAPSTPHYAVDGKAPISNLNFAELQRHIHSLNLQLKQRDMLIDSYIRDMEKMKQVTRTIVETGEKLTKEGQINVSNSGCDSYDYFNSYSHFGIHHDMLNDKVRTESYRDAILTNSDQFRGKIVLDVGCGTGILAMFSAKAGAQKIYGVDQSEVVYKAMDIVRENNLADRVHLIKGQLEKTNLPIEMVDIVVSEWMGYFLLFEGMLDSFIFARDKYLKPGGLILPSRCTISLCGVSDIERYDNLINFWDDVYGFSMKCMKSEVVQEAVIETVAQDKVITDSIVVTDIDLNTCGTDTCNFSNNFVFKSMKAGILTAVAGYFDTFFELTNKVGFSTGPHAPKTHWQQTVFYLKDTIEVQEGESIEGSITCSRLKKNLRGLSVTIVLKNKTFQYTID
ncbi:uncharacterized protein LOC132704878 isoform X2 [Cylas formicarius]|nr:uncharacterized protein LOC132704878 isoform X2 [Cylas formicarius]